MQPARRGFRQVEHLQVSVFHGLSIRTYIDMLSRVPTKPTPLGAQYQMVSERNPTIQISSSKTLSPNPWQDLAVLDAEKSPQPWTLTGTWYFDKLHKEALPGLSESFGGGPMVQKLLTWWGC